MGVKVGTVVLLLSVLVGVAAASASTPKAGWIVFPASPDNATDGQHLFRVRLDGTGLRQLTFGRGVSADPAFSPDGKRIVFEINGLFRINADGTGLKRLTPNPCDHAPAWSPDGTRIAFVRCHHLYVMRADGRRPHRLAYAPAPVARPTWSSDGRIFLAAAAVPAGTRLVEVGAGDGHVKRRLQFEVRARPEYVYPALSPNGRRVAFIDLRPCPDCRYEAFALYTGRSSAKHARRLIDDAGVPTWSADSTRLIYPYRGTFHLRSFVTGTDIAIRGLPPSLIVTGPAAWQPR